MTNSLEQFKKNLYIQKNTHAPIFYIYGNPGMGKSSLAASFPDPFFLMTEVAFPSDDRLQGRSIHIDTYEKLMDNLRLIYRVLKDNNFTIKTLVIDNISGIEHLISNDYFMKEQKRLDELPFAGGHKIVKQRWCEPKGIYDAIKCINEDFGVAIILIDHCSIASTSLPNKDTFNRYVPATYPIVYTNLIKLIDEVMFIDVIYQDRIEEGNFGKKNLKVTASSKGLLIRSGNGQPEYVSKSRYGLPTQIIYREGEGFTCLKDLLPKWYEDTGKEIQEISNSSIEE